MIRCAPFVLLVFALLLPPDRGRASPAAPTLEEVRALRAAIGRWPALRSERVPTDGTGDGDALLFAGILAFSGEELGVDSIHASQDQAGGLWRSPAQIGRGTVGLERLSFDQLLGVLLYLVSDPQPERARAFAGRFASWLQGFHGGPRPELTDGFVMCHWTGFSSFDACALSGLHYRNRGRLLRAVFEHLNVPVPSRDGRPLGMGGSAAQVVPDLLTVCHLRDTGGKFHCHLAAVAALVLQKLGQEASLPRQLAGFAHNPFYQYAANGGRATPAIWRQTYAVCSAAQQDFLNRTHQRSQWLWQRSDRETGLVEKACGWDCVAMLNLLLREPS